MDQASKVEHVAAEDIGDDVVGAGQRNLYHLAEIPVLPGCRAWGATAEEALSNLEGVAADFIASCEDHGDQLPASVVGTGNS